MFRFAYAIVDDDDDDDYEPVQGANENFGKILITTVSTDYLYTTTHVHILLYTQNISMKLIPFENKFLNTYSCFVCLSVLIHFLMAQYTDFNSSLSMA